MFPYVPEIDVDHTGVPNTQLVKENATLNTLYEGRSVAEQNSVDLAWDLLMDSNLKDLRAAIYSTQEEMQRFRELVVNSVYVRKLSSWFYYRINGRKILT